MSNMDDILLRASIVYQNSFDERRAILRKNVEDKSFSKDIFDLFVLSEKDFSYGEKFIRDYTTDEKMVKLFKMLLKLSIIYTSSFPISDGLNEFNNYHNTIIQITSHILNRLLEHDSLKQYIRPHVIKHLIFTLTLIYFAYSNRIPNDFDSLIFSKIESRIGSCMCCTYQDIYKFNLNLIFYSPFLRRFISEISNSNIGSKLESAFIEYNDIFLRELPILSNKFKYDHVMNQLELRTKSLNECCSAIQLFQSDSTIEICRKMLDIWLLIDYAKSLLIFKEAFFIYFNSSEIPFLCTQINRIFYMSNRLVESSNSDSECLSKLREICRNLYDALYDNYLTVSYGVRILFINYMVEFEFDETSGLGVDDEEMVWSTSGIKINHSLVNQAKELAVLLACTVAVIRHFMINNLDITDIEAPRFSFLSVCPVRKKDFSEIDRCYFSNNVIGSYPELYKHFNLKEIIPTKKTSTPKNNHETIILNDIKIESKGSSAIFIPLNNQSTNRSRNGFKVRIFIILTIWSLISFLWVLIYHFHLR
jgi:hypothetical protein